MIIYFIGALLFGYTLYQLVSYSAAISLMATAGKVAAALLLAAVLVLLIRKFRRTPRVYRLPGVKDK